MCADADTTLVPSDHVFEFTDDVLSAAGVTDTVAESTVCARIRRRHCLIHFSSLYVRTITGIAAIGRVTRLFVSDYSRLGE